MVKNPLKIVWSLQAKSSLKAIYDFYKEKNLQGAQNVKSDILSSPKKIYFAEQYQQDDINPRYRRIVVRDYKVLYLERENEIRVVDVVSTRQSPEVLKNIKK